MTSSTAIQLNIPSSPHHTHQTYWGSISYCLSIYLLQLFKRFGILRFQQCLSWFHNHITKLHHNCELCLKVWEFPLVFSKGAQIIYGHWATFNERKVSFVGWRIVKRDSEVNMCFKELYLDCLLIGRGNICENWNGIIAQIFFRALSKSFSLPAVMSCFNVLFSVPSSY